MLKVHKICLDPNDRQKTLLAKSAGVARFAYNWALGEWGRMYEAHKENPALEKPSQSLLRKHLNSVKREQYPWMLEVSKCAPQEAIINLGKAFRNFFDGRAGHPTFKKKGIHDSFKISSGFFRVSERSIHIPKIGEVRMREELRFEGRLVSLNVSRRADKWYAAITLDVEEQIPIKKTSGLVVGVDVGVRDFVRDDGSKMMLPRAYATAQKKLKRAQRDLSRKKKGSRNRAKAIQRVARLHARVSDIRADFLHKYTSSLTDEAAVIAIEDLNVKGMMKNHHLAKSLADASFGEFRRQLTYKCERSGTHLVIAERFFPSSKQCHVCGHRQAALPLSVRTWACPECGATHDRDVNAAINLRKYAESSPVSVCGEFFASATLGSPSSASSLCEAETKRQSA